MNDSDVKYFSAHEFHRFQNVCSYQMDDFYQTPVTGQTVYNKNKHRYRLVHKAQNTCKNLKPSYNETKIN